MITGSRPKFNKFVGVSLAVLLLVLVLVAALGLVDENRTDQASAATAPAIYDLGSARVGAPAGDITLPDVSRSVVTQTLRYVSEHNGQKYLLGNGQSHGESCLVVVESSVEALVGCGEDLVGTWLLKERSDLSRVGAMVVPFESDSVTVNDAAVRPLEGVVPFEAGPGEAIKVRALGQDGRVFERVIDPSGPFVVTPAP